MFSRYIFSAKLKLKSICQISWILINIYIRIYLKNILSNLRRKSIQCPIKTESNVITSHFHQVTYSPNKNKHTMWKILALFYVSLICLGLSVSPVDAYGRRQLRFNSNGRFKILQVSDMHYGFGKETQCSNVTPEELPYCSDLNTTSFIQRTIASEKPDLIVFSGTTHTNELCFFNIIILVCFRIFNVLL